jgi:hypothetical protein
VVSEEVEGGGVHASLVASDKATECFAVTLPRPFYVGIRVTHGRAL